MCKKPVPQAPMYHTAYPQPSSRQLAEEHRGRGSTSAMPVSGRFDIDNAVRPLGPVAKKPIAQSRRRSDSWVTIGLPVAVHRRSSIHTNAACRDTATCHGGGSAHVSIGECNLSRLEKASNFFAERGGTPAVRAHGMSALLQAFPKLQIGSCEKDGFGPNLRLRSL